MIPREIVVSICQGIALEINSDIWSNFPTRITLKVQKEFIQWLFGISPALSVGVPEKKSLEFSDSQDYIQCFFHGNW